MHAGSFVPSMHWDVTLFIVTIAEVHVLIDDDFVCYYSLTFCVFFYYLLTGSAIPLITTQWLES